jgi:hypothetical protein
VLPVRGFSVIDVGVSTVFAQGEAQPDRWPRRFTEQAGAGVTNQKNREGEPAAAPRPPRY